MLFVCPSHDIYFSELMVNNDLRLSKNLKDVLRRRGNSNFMGYIIAYGIPSQRLGTKGLIAPLETPFGDWARVKVDLSI